MSSGCRRSICLLQESTTDSMSLHLLGLGLESLPSDVSLRLRRVSLNFHSVSALHSLKLCESLFCGISYHAARWYKKLQELGM